MVRFLEKLIKIKSLESSQSVSMRTTLYGQWLMMMNFWPRSRCQSSQNWAHIGSGGNLTAEARGTRLINRRPAPEQS